MMSSPLSAFLLADEASLRQKLPKDFKLGFEWPMKKMSHPLPK
jgi:hypothetical protein